jgi:hypothetical protein
MEEVKHIVERNKGEPMTGEFQDWHHYQALQNQNLAQTLNKIKEISPDQKNEESQKMNELLPMIIKKIAENRTKYNDLFKKTYFQGAMSFLGRDSARQQTVEEEQKRIDEENIELGRLKKDIESQLPYYRGGTRKLRRKRIKRTRVR